MTNQVEVVLKEAGEWTLTYGDNINYVMVGNSPQANGSTITVGSSPVTLIVVANDGSQSSTFTLAYTAASGDNTKNEVANGGNLALGTNEVTEYADDGYSATVYLTAGDDLPAGEYTLTFTYLWSMSLKIDGVSVSDDGKGNATTTVTLGDTPITIYLEQGSYNVVVVVEAKS